MKKFGKFQEILGILSGIFRKFGSSQEFSGILKEFSLFKNFKES
jgi:hypothetical protein